MNFNQRGTCKKQNLIQSTSRKLITKTEVSIFRIIIAGIIIIIIMLLFAGYGFVKGIIDKAPSIEEINVQPSTFSTTIYDNNGNEIITIAGSNANRKYVELDKIPKILQQAFIAIEDERFMEHNGIDVKGILRALFVGIGKFDITGAGGASTITQQLLKNQVFEGGNETNFINKIERKLQEQYLAIQLEQKLTKKEILEYYLNTINLGQNTLGVQAASLRYFGKDVSEINLSEASVIAAITQSPSNLNPITNPEKNSKRRNLVLEHMEEQNYISKEEKQQALDDDVYSRIQIVNKEVSSSSNIYSYFVDALMTQLVEDLQKEKDYTQTQAYNALYRGGLSIYTTQDTRLQKICDDTIANCDYFPADSKWELTYRLSIKINNDETKNYSEGSIRNYFAEKNQEFSLLFNKKEEANPYIEEFKQHVLDVNGGEVIGEQISFTIQPQISFTLIDQYTGEVKAIVGGRGEKEANRTLNRAYDSTRQPGSTFKVVSTYLPALDTAGMTLATVIDDAQYSYPDGTPIKNHNNRYNGLSTLREGIYNSMNIVTVKTLELVTPQISYDYLTNLGFSTIVKSETDENGRIYSDINLPLALGGLTKGVTNLELTAAFAAIANDGVYIKPTFYTKVLDHNGKVLLDKPSETRQVMKESSAWLLTNAMEDVVKIGTGKYVQFLNSTMPIAGKTGTTTANNDLWFSGFTPYYTASIWTGYDNNGSLNNTSFHKLLWRDIMEQVNSGLEIVSFEKPNTIETATICTKSGKLAIEGICDYAPGASTMKTEYFASGTAPTEKCDVHASFNVCSQSGKLATEFCPASSIVNKICMIKKETSETADTPYLMSSGLEGSYCNIHTSNYTSPNTDLNGDNDDNNGDILDGDDNNTDNENINENPKSHNIFDDIGETIKNITQNASSILS